MKRNNCFLLALCVISLLIVSCGKKDSDPVTPTPPPGVPDLPITPQVDPDPANTIGFFLNDWVARSFTVPTTTTASSGPAAAIVTVSVDRSNVVTKIPRSIAGNNANMWMTQIVTEPTLMDHITTIHPHIIRFPGGSASDVFFWNAAPGAAPADAPAQLVKADGTSAASGYWFGKNTGGWTFSVDNYYNMLQQTGNQGMITINYGYARYGTGTNPVAAAAHLAADWVRYDRGRTKYWEIGNENFGDWEAGYRIKLADNKDGQPEFLTGQLYGQHFKVFADSMRKAAQEVGATIYIGCVTSEQAPLSWWTSTAKNWNSGIVSGAGSTPDYYIVHNYYTAYQTNAKAAEILSTPIDITGPMMSYVKQVLANGGITQKPVVLNEWNIFSQGSKQAVSQVNGLHAVLVLGEAIKNKYGMTSRWDLANGWDNGNDHGMFSSGDEPDGVAKWTPRPAFYHMYFFQKYLGDRLVSSSSNSTDIISYASSFTSGETAVALVNKSADVKTVEISITNFKKGLKYYWYTLSGSSDNGEFSRKTIINNVAPTQAAGGPADYKTIAPFSASTTGGIKVTVPGLSSVFLVVEKN
ncbi:MAG TPA: hypothetical protein VLC98_01555 [Phnomibacter sp.]|nr:hypothetical protein [Phnomibacter sp.]